MGMHRNVEQRPYFDLQAQFLLVCLVVRPVIVVKRGSRAPVQAPGSRSAQDFCISNESRICIQVMRGLNVHRL